MRTQHFYSVKLLQKSLIARDIMELHFEKPAGFSFTPGQFVQFRIPQADRFVLRNYSIASHPDEDDLEFCAKILPEGKASVFFTDLPAGDAAAITPPKGVFVCRPGHSAAKMFIATGAGIAPITSLIKGELKHLTLPAGKLRLLFGIRTPADIFWIERFERFAEAYSQFSFYVTLSRPSAPWTGLTGRVTAHLPELMLQGADYYLCGSVEMIKDVRAMLLAQGVNTKSIHLEIF